MRKHGQPFKLLFFTINLLFVTSNQILTYKKNKFVSHKQYIFSLITSRNARKTQTDQSIPDVSLLCLKRNDTHKWQREKLFSPLRLFVLCDIWKTLLFIIVYSYSEIVLTTMLLLSLKPLFWRKSVFYALSPQ